MTRSGTSLATPAALGLTAALWASAFPAIKVGLDGYGAAGLSFGRLLVASVVLGLAAPVLKVRLPGIRDLPMIAFCGAAGMSAYQLLLNWGEVHVPAGTASLLVAIAPMFSVVLASIFLNERFGVRIAVGSLIALTGSAAPLGCRVRGLGLRGRPLHPVGVDRGALPGAGDRRRGVLPLAG